MNQRIISEYIGTFHFLQKHNYIESIDVMFEYFLYEDWKEDTFENIKIKFVTFLRANSAIKKRLSHYKPLKEKATKFLKNNNIPPEKVLKGII